MFKFSQSVGRVLQTIVNYSFNVQKAFESSQFVDTAKSKWTLQNMYEWNGLLQIHNEGPWRRHKRRHPLDERPQMKGIVIRTIIKKPKKPNSANRKCVLVKLSNGKESIAHVPGVGHTLQEHSVVLVHKRRTKDVPGLKLKVIRGRYDCPLPTKQTNN